MAIDESLDNPYLCITIDSWADIIEISDNLLSHVFRGQSNANWELSTSFERLTTSNDFEYINGIYHNREKWILTQFRRRAHLYISSPPDDNEYIEWMALIQHFGGPTRLLDFTHSIFIAAFFAVENSDTDSAIWAINHHNIFGRSASLAGKWEENDTIFDVNKKHVTYANLSIQEEKDDNCVLCVEPMRMNERLSVQQGLFLFPCNITMTFMQNLASVYRINPRVFSDKKPSEYKKSVNIEDFDIIKIIIPKELNRKIFEKLYDMNISAASLFPGLDGFARSLKYHLSMFSD